MHVTFTSTLLAGPEKVTVTLTHPCPEMVTSIDFPGESVPLDGWTGAPRDADHLRETLPVLVSVVEHVQEPPVGLDLQFGSLNKVKLVGLADSLGGLGVGVGVG